VLSKLADETGEDLRERVRLHVGDARDVIQALGDRTLGRVFILFPDPWPKKRHHKRRFVQTAILDALARVMKPGAELRFASDDPGYVRWTLERLTAHPAFRWQVHGSQDWNVRPPNWPATRYELKALCGSPSYFRFARRAEGVNLGA
jgi:tRNA (guanine-N7-)-methyltransferase